MQVLPEQLKFLFRQKNEVIQAEDRLPSKHMSGPLSSDLTIASYGRCRIWMSCTAKMISKKSFLTVIS
jgi:hypothetical protein